MASIFSVISVKVQICIALLIVIIVLITVGAIWEKNREADKISKDNLKNLKETSMTVAKSIINHQLDNQMAVKTSKLFERIKNLSPLSKANQITYNV